MSGPVLCTQVCEAAAGLAVGAVAVAQEGGMLQVQDGNIALRPRLGLLLCGR